MTGAGGGPQPRLRAIALPAEHGGWGLTLEPGLLGLLLAPSLAGLLLAAAALLAFLLRTPVRLVLIGRRRGATPRTAMGLARDRLARQLAAVELAGLASLVILAAVLARDPAWWLPALVAAPLFGVALWFDMHGHSRYLVAELAGSVAVASVAAMATLAGGAGIALAIGAWLILCARVSSSIPHVRGQVLRLHGDTAPPQPMLLGDLAALLLAGSAVVVAPPLVAGGVAVVGLIAVQRLTLAQPPRPARILGLRQMALGAWVVVVTAVGAWVLQPAG